MMEAGELRCTARVTDQQDDMTKCVLSLVTAHLSLAIKHMQPKAKSTQLSWLEANTGSSFKN